MDISKFMNMGKLCGLIGITLLLTACPDEDCNTISPSAIVPDKARFIPMDTIFQQNDTLRFTVTIPSEIQTDNDGLVDIRERYGVTRSNKSLGIIDVLNENSFSVIKGEIDDLQIILEYSEQSDQYEFECLVTLERTGEYVQTNNILRFRFDIGEEECDFLDVRTSLENIDSNNDYRFRVEN